MNNSEAKLKIPPKWDKKDEISQRPLCLGFSWQRTNVRITCAQVLQAG